MTVEIQQRERQKGLLSNSTLLLIAFATAFFPRVLDTAGFPSAVNFIHFAMVPFACGVALIKTRVRDKKQIASITALFLSLIIFFGVMTMSALVNNAGLINVFINFLLLAEAYVFLLAIVSIPFSLESFRRFRRWILGFALVHMLLAFGQKVLLDIGALAVPIMTKEDNVQGVFYLSGSGHVVGASVSMTFGMYYFISAKSAPIGLRAGVLLATFMQMLFADAKQVLMVFLAAWLILILLQVKNVQKTLQYVILAVLIGYTLYWCIENVEAFRAFKTWIRPEIYGPDGDATILKSGPLRIIPTYYKSALNWLFGLGPGHTIGRLGGWMLIDYSSLLSPLGSTTHPVSQVVWNTWRGHYLDSSFFSPLWGFAGIWGDLGFLGIANYVWILLVTWQRFCLDDFSRFLVLNIFLHGFIFTQLEEPGYMISLTTLIGLRWQELFLQQRSQQYQRLWVSNPYFQLPVGLQEAGSDRDPV